MERRLFRRSILNRWTAASFDEFEMYHDITVNAGDGLRLIVRPSAASSD
jgi:hypothetical protein